MATDIPVVVTTQGAQPTPPAALLAALVQLVTATNPGYTANLPGSLVEDISSTDVGALTIIDSARVELLNSLSPYVANNFLMWQLGQVYIGPGAAPAVPTNTSVFVTFTTTDPNTAAPLPGYLIPRGFVVSDGVYQYVVQDGGVTDSNGNSQPLFCQATIPGSWSVATSSVNQIVTSVPTNVVSMACRNTTPGTPGGPQETAAQYRARVLQAGLAISTGTPALLKTLLAQVPGVQQRLISVLQQPGGFWEVLCGGGDPYLTAGAILASGVNVAGLVGSTLAITAITKASNGQITTALNHGYSPGQVAQAADIVGMTALNGVPFTVVTVVDEKNFTINIDTTAYSPYVSGGVLTPNLRNVSVSLYNYPDIYTFPFVNPPQQTVTMAVTWRTSSTNFVSSAAIAQAAAPALAAYVNSVVAGQPMSLLVLQQTFLVAVSDILAPGLFSSLAFAVSINGVATAPTGDLFFGDPESFFEATAGGISVVQV